MKKEDQSAVDYNAVLTVVAGSTDEVDVTATLNEGVSPKYRGDYTDVLTFTVTQEAQDGESVLIRSYAELKDLITGAVNDGSETKALLISNIEVPQNDYLTVGENQEIVLDLNGYTISSKYEPSVSEEMFLVNGKLTVKNGNLRYESTNLEIGFNPYYRATIFTIQSAGSLSMETVTAKNTGGNWMAYVVDMSNSVGLSLSVNDCQLESSYIPVRVFNNANNMHTVDISDSTLKGKTLAFWVQYYTDDKNGMSKDEIDATLSIDIFGKNNVFSVTQEKYQSPIIYGYNTFVFINPETGDELS